MLAIGAFPRAGNVNMLLAARPCTKARKDFPALVRPVAVRQRAPASDAMSMSAEPTAASDQLSGRSLSGIALSEGEPGASDPSGIGDGVRWRPPMGPALRWPVGQAFEPPETPAVRRSHARHRCRSPDRMGGHRPKKLVCATGVAAAAVPGQGVHLARPSRRAGRAWPQRRLSCGLAVRS